MFPLQRFKPTHQALLLAMIAAAYPLVGYTAAGRLDFVIGRVTAVGADGKERALLKGSEINAGDAVNTGADGRAQIRFTDGAFMSLQPGTTFRVDQYRYSGKTDGSEKGFFSLVKGGLRTITGAIGHGKNQDAYQVATPAATIGIRGTGYNAQLGNSLTVSVGEGAIALLNNGGELILRAGQTGYVQDFNTSPQLTFEKPSTPPASVGGGNTQPQTPPAQYGSGNNPGGGTGSTVLTNVVGLMARDPVFRFPDPGGPTIAADFPGTVVMDSTGNRVYFQDTHGVITGFPQATLDTAPSGNYASHGFDGIIGWGRWYGTITYAENGTVTTKPFSGPSDINSGLHGVVGIPTAALPTLGFAHYALAGATRPTDGSTTPGSAVSGSIDVYFSGIPGSINEPFLSGTYSYNLGGLRYFSFSSYNTPSTPWTNGMFAATGSYFSTATGAVSVAGFFAGTNAERIGITFEGTPSTGGIHHGAAVFTQSSFSATVPPVP